MFLFATIVIATYRYLIEKHHYAQNAVQAKIYCPYENGFSDDILTFFPYYMLSHYAREDAYWPYFQKSIERTWTVCRPDRMPTWNIIASIFLQKDCDLEIAREELELFPVDLIDWNMTNSHRWNLIENDLVERGGERQAINPIPTPKQEFFGGIRILISSKAALPAKGRSPELTFFFL